MDGIDSGSWGEIIVGALALILSVFIFFWSRRRPKISYLIDLTKIIHVQGVSPGELAIHFKGCPVSTLVLCSIRIKNTGNFPVKIEDWQKPLEISFPQEVNILDSRISAASTDELDIEFSVDQQRIIKISPVLLNQKDGFILEVLTDNEIKPRVSARIFDVEKLDEVRPEKNSLTFLGLILFSMLGFVLIYLSAFIEILQPYRGYLAIALFTLAVFPLFILLAANLFAPEKKMRIK